MVFFKVRIDINLPLSSHHHEFLGLLHQNGNAENLDASDHSYNLHPVEESHKLVLLCLKEKSYGYPRDEVEQKSGLEVSFTYLSYVLDRGCITHWYIVCDEPEENGDCKDDF